MKIYTKIVFDIATGNILEEEGYEYEGEVALCKGASAAQDSLNASQTQFYNTLSNDYNQQFANQSSILSGLTSALTPTVNAGANQFGYSNNQVNNLNSTAIQGVAQNYNNAQKSLQNQQAAQGGGNMMLPSGVAAQNSANLAASGANQQSSELLGIQNAGYAQGNTNYNNAVSALGGVASQYNPTGYASSATSAGNSAASEANTITQENNAASPWGAIGGILGGAAGSFLGPLGTSLGSKLGGALGGGSSTTSSFGNPFYEGG